MRLEDQDLKFDAKDVREVTEKDIEWAKRNIGVENYFDGHTLCDTIRKIYEISQTLDDKPRDEIQKRCLVIFCYAKRMNAKLIQYAREKEPNG